MKIKKLPVGVSDFKNIVRDNYCYVDKTLNLSMLKYFYDCCPAEKGKEEDQTNANKNLFDSLAISKAGKKYLDHMGKYPVIFLTFRDIKEMEWETCMDKTEGLIQDECLKHDYLLNSQN